MYSMITKLPKQYLGIARVAQVLMPNIPILGIVFRSKKWLTMGKYSSHLALGLIQTNDKVVA